MKNLYRIIFLIIITNNLNAQNDEGEIEDAQVLIEKNSSIILQNSDKSIDKIDLEVNNFKKFKTSFEIINFKFDDDTRKIDKKPINDIELENNYPTELKILGGNYKSYLFQFNPQYKFNDKLFVYSNFFLKSNSRGSLNQDLSKNKLYDNNITFYYKLNNYNLFSSNLSLISSSNGFYGFKNNFQISDKLKKNLISVKNNYIYNVSWLGFKKDLHYEVVFLGHNLRENSFIKIAENKIDLNGNISLKLKKLNFSLEPLINFYKLGKHSSTISGNVYPLTIRKFEIPLSMKYYGKNFSVGISTKYLSFKRKLKKPEKVNKFYSKLNFSFSKDFLSVFISIEDNLSHESYSNIINDFPHLYDPYLFNNISLTETHYNFKSKVYFDLSENVNLNFGFQRLSLTGNLDYDFYRGDILPPEISFPIYLYTVIRNNNQEYINKYEINADIKIADNLSGKFEFIYNQYEEIEVFMPNYETKISGIYQLKKIKVDLNLDMLLNNNGLNFNNETFKMNNILNLNLNSFYQINENVKIHFNIYNILNNYNELFFMYPQLGTNVMTGLTWKF